MTPGTVQVGSAAVGGERGQGVESARAASRSSPTASIRNGLLAMALCWQGLVMGPDPALWPTAYVGSWLVVPVGLTWLAWVLLILAFGVRRTAGGFIWVKVVDVVLLVVAGLGVFIQAAVDDRLSAGFATGATMVNLGVGLAGMLLPRVLARWLIGVAIGLESLLVLAAWQAGVGSAEDALLYPLYAVAIGAGSQGARQALMRAAGQHQVALAEIRRARVQAAAVWSIRRELARQESLIHETVLNTLAAIARGGLPQDGAAIRAAAASSASVMAVMAGDLDATWRSATGVLGTDLSPLLDRLRAQGVEPRLLGTVDLQADLRPTVSTQAYEGMLVGIREALSNVERHARAQRTEVRVEVVRARGPLDELRVTVSDDGLGFDPVATDSRFGLEQSIHRTMLEVGGTAVVVSRPGEGTIVQLTLPVQRPTRPGSWMRPLGSDEEVMGGTIPRGNAAFARPVLVWFGAFVVVSALVTIGSVARPGLTLAALALILALGLALWVLSARPALPGWFVLLTAVLAPVAYRLQAAAVGGSGFTHWLDWSSEALAVLWLVVTAVGPWWTVLVALGSWLFMQGDPLGELLQPGTAIILAGALFARSVRRNGRAFAAAERQRTVEMTSVVADAQVLERLQARLGLLGESHALALLEAVADGRLHPEERQVQAACDREERYIRSVMRLDPAADLVHRRAGEAAVRCYRAGRFLDISLDETEGWPEATVGEFFGEISRLLDLADSGTTARLTARREGDVQVMRFVSGDGSGVLEVRHG